MTLIDKLNKHKEMIAVKWEAKAEAYKEAANILANAISE